MMRYKIDEIFENLNISEIVVDYFGQMYDLKMNNEDNLEHFSTLLFSDETAFVDYRCDFSKRIKKDLKPYEKLCYPPVNNTFVDPNGGLWEYGQALGDIRFFFKPKRNTTGISTSKLRYLYHLKPDTIFLPIQCLIPDYPNDKKLFFDDTGFCFVKIDNQYLFYSEYELVDVEMSRIPILSDVINIFQFYDIRSVIKGLTFKEIEDLKDEQFVLIFHENKLYLLNNFNTCYEKYLKPLMERIQPDVDDFNSLFVYPLFGEVKVFNGRYYGQIDNCLKEVSGCDIKFNDFSRKSLL